MSILILNAGSSTLKWAVFADAGDTVLASDTVRWTGGSESGRQERVDAAIAAAGDVRAIGHRIVHGGEKFSAPALLDAATLVELEKLNALAPLHNPPALACIYAAAKAAPQAIQVAAFDTSFHRTLPPEAATYALPRAWRDRWPLHRYGFHGLSVEYAVQRAATLLGREPGRHVVCHLGAGCSITAVRDGKSVDTSMGFTPLEGVVMATRAGTVDPGLLLFLARQGLTADELSDGLEHRAGLAGLSGLSGDLRDVRRAALAGDEAATLAILVLQRSLIRVIGSMAAVLGGLDILTFTGGIGEHDAVLRRDLVERLAFLGVRLDERHNNEAGPDRDIAHVDAPARVLVIEAREDITILRAVRTIVH